ncbi:hypothetical protein [Bacillus weihaiensis]|uniref:DUF3221 domain-containing protein n=1 Tax=Bacillus weihaiensis TaxID=1547283 RepID=A0A1L3MS43_9BACI|nr:hypothetical protein [Bacillus weihaiensis]APH05156.1 hypothetical protein A9C19_10575 [Bacillus weihaiensis]
MKAKVWALFILSILLLFLINMIAKPFGSDKQVIDDEEGQDFTTFTYVITKVEGSDYYGSSLDGKTKIHFNSNEMSFPLTEKIRENDKIVAYVQSENHVEGFVKVKKINE